MQYEQRDSGVYAPRVFVPSRDLTERIAELETGNDDGLEWIRLGDADFEFSREFRLDITRLARVMYLKNPIVGRGVRVKADYVYGRRVSFTANDDRISAVVKQFVEDLKNQDELTAHAAMIAKEIELQTDGNIFFTLHVHPITGRVRVRTIPANEITEIVTNPDDRKERWYYKREWTEKYTDINTGELKERSRVAYYIDWRYKPDVLIDRIGSHQVVSGVSIYHVKVGGFSEWKFGIPEIYSALDWAKGYKKFLENWSTIVAAYARFAFSITTPGGKSGVAAAKARLASTIGVNDTERNPKPAAGSVFVQSDGNRIDPIRTAGATTSAEDGRRLLLMVAAGFGLPETFFGDVSVGTLATATSLDRPTELMLSNRQALWQDVFTDILAYVLAQAVIAPRGALRSIATVLPNEYGEDEVIYDDDVDPTVSISFPQLIEKDTEAKIRAIVTASTFDGKTPSIVNDPKLLARLVLDALGVNDVDTIITRLYPDDSAIADDENELANASEALRFAIAALREVVTQ